MLQSFSYSPSHHLSYSDTGPSSGNPILVQHGLIASVRDTHLFHRLSALGCRLISIARPGYGESTPCELASYAEWGQIVSALVSHLNLSRFDVFGISSGAPYAYAAAHALPGLVQRIFILSGFPALYDPGIRSLWPYPPGPDLSLPAMQKLARELFFSGLSDSDLASDDIRDSMRNDCFGVALDLRLRYLDWGFQLFEIRQPVFMRHSRGDSSYQCAERTAQLLPDCAFESVDGDIHFSQEFLDDFITSVMAPRLPAPPARG